MTVVSKAALRRSLDHTRVLDTQAASPYVGLHLGDGQIHVRRTANSGFVETEGAPDPTDPGWVFPGLLHLLECLRYMESDSVDILRLNTGSLMIRSVNTAFESELRVHTVTRANAVFKIHDPGDPYKDVEIAWLRGLDVKRLPLVAAPVIAGTKLVLITNTGTISWDTEVDPELPAHPREAFLRVLGDTTTGMMTLTTHGYFATCFDGMVFVIAGHQTPLHLPVPSSDGLQRVAAMAAERLVQALRNVSSLAAVGAPITMSPRGGLQTRNTYGQPVRFGLGDLSPFIPFDIYSATAKTVADALDQAKGDEVNLFRVPSAQDRIVFERGNCTVAIQAARSVQAV